MSEGQIVHIEIAAKDPEAVGKFYSSIFGWKFEYDKEMDYGMFEPADAPGGGFPKIDSQMYNVGTVLVYISTENIEQKLSEINMSGGKVILPRTEIPQMGWFALFNDPTRNLIGLFSDKPAGKAWVRNAHTP